MRSYMPAPAPLLRHREEERPPRLTRLLVNVTVDRSQLWPVHVVLGADGTVADLARAAVAAYAREGHRPPLPPADDDGFELHFSKYSLDALDPEEKVADLGSRNFFLCAATPEEDLPPPLEANGSNGAAGSVILMEFENK